MGIEAIAALAGLVFPPVMKFVQKKWLKGTADPQETIGSLSMSSPETLPVYIEALSKLYSARTQWFNRDIVGSPSLWLVNLRGAIRPVSVPLCILILAVDGFLALGLDSSVKAAFTLNISSWFGDRL